MDTESVTIGVPVYNGEKYIGETLKSILSQTYRNIEVIVSDNCSVDSTVEVVREIAKSDPRVRLNVNKQNIGFSGNLNTLIGLADTDYIALYHADDVYDPRIVEVEKGYLDANPDIAGCFTLANHIDGEGRPKKDGNPFNLIKEDIRVDLDMFIENLCLQGCMFYCPTSMISKKAYQAVGGYDTGLKYIEDLDMWTRLLERYDLGIVGEKLFKYRIHANQGSSYYTSRKRTELTVDVLFLEKYLKNHPSLMDKNKSVFMRKMAMEYIALARNAIYAGDYDYFLVCIEKSKEYCSIKNWSKYGIMQRYASFPLYLLVRLFAVNA
jgi:glycosyltransferase involved in cell wall biosynthesis